MKDDTKAKAVLGVATELARPDGPTADDAGLRAALRALHDADPLALAVMAAVLERRRLRPMIQ